MYNGIKIHQALSHAVSSQAWRCYTQLIEADVRCVVLFPKIFHTP